MEQKHYNQGFVPKMKKDQYILCNGYGVAIINIKERIEEKKEEIQESRG